MGDLHRLNAALRDHGPVTRVIVTGTRGSAPREVGAEMWVTAEGLIHGTIGGGALEFDAIRKAQNLTTSHSETRALGPDLGQCCGGAVTLSYDVVTETLAANTGPILRRIEGADTPPWAITKALAEMRNGTRPARTILTDGWLISPFASPPTPLWVWGAGHVGRAIVALAAPLPDYAITWIDTAENRFPPDIPYGVTQIPTDQPARLATHAPQGAHHLILTYSHELDLALCDALLRRGAAFTGLIGSASKWARFRKRLRQMGHGPDTIAQITCPIGEPTLGKHPQHIALGVVHSLLTAAGEPASQTDDGRDMTKDTGT